MGRFVESVVGEWMSRKMSVTQKINLKHFSEVPSAAPSAAPQPNFIPGEPLGVQTFSSILLVLHQEARLVFKAS